MLLAEGGESQSLALLAQRGWNNIGAILTTPVHQDLSGRGGVRSLRCQNNGSFTSPIVGPTAYRLSVWVVPEQFLTGPWGVIFLRSGVTNVAVQISPVDNKVRIQATYGGTTLATSAGTINPQVAHWFTMEVVCANAGGTVDVKVDGILAVSYTGDTQNSANPDWDQFIAQGATFQSTVWDDIIIQTVAEADTGEVFIERRAVASNDSIQSTSSGGGGAGSGTFANVNEVPPTSATYNEFTTGQQDTYGITAGTWTGTAVPAVKVVYYAARDGAVTQYEAALKSGATTAYGAVDTLGAAGVYVFNESIFTTDPNTAAAWVPGAAVDAVKIGGKFT